MNQLAVQTTRATGPTTRATPFKSEDIVLRHLKTPSDIASILHLREEIDLSVHAACGAQFAALEKKEMSSDSSSRSTCMES